ncbi:MAG: ABC transporter permease [Akkermansiaceae bacterium]|jgi:rhamnose transport system permease protein|nr:ABC transporter permease [Akkermansiaceae bacterium]MBJ7284759.1 ABC transporter permease [Akkermansiaceae bacterium]MBJ7424248.1 ABC transporter permease [Akkermansiaceae bacterium]
MNKYFREITVAIALALLILSLAIFAPHFFQAQPLVSRLTSQMPALVAAVGIALVIISRQIDISIGAQFSMCAIVAGVTASAGFPLGIAILAALVTGALMGAVNGVLVAYLGLPSIVVTLATMVTWQEALRLWQQGRLLALPNGIQWFGLSQQVGQIVVISVAFTLVVGAAWAMKNLSGGRQIYAIGTDAEAARLAGIDPKRTTFRVFVLMGLLTGLAAVLNLVQSPQVQPNCGDGLDLKTIAAVVVGGVAISGGRGTMWGVLLGMLLLANVNPALTHFHQPPYWEKAIQGLVILLAVVADGLRSRKTQF